MDVDAATAKETGNRIRFHQGLRTRTEGGQAYGGGAAGCTYGSAAGLQTPSQPRSRGLWASAAAAELRGGILTLHPARPVA